MEFFNSTGRAFYIQVAVPMRLPDAGRLLVTNPLGALATSRIGRLWQLSPKVQDRVHDAELSQNEHGQHAEVDGMNAAADDEIAQGTEENQAVNSQVEEWPKGKTRAGNGRKRPQ